MNLNYKGKTAVVTGSSGGIGLKTSEKLLKNKITTLMLDIKNPPKDFIKNFPNAIFEKVAQGRFWTRAKWF